MSDANITGILQRYLYPTLQLKMEAYLIAKMTGIEDNFERTAKMIKREICLLGNQILQTASLLSEINPSKALSILTNEPVFVTETSGSLFKFSRCIEVAIPFSSLIMHESSIEIRTSEVKNLNAPQAFLNPVNFSISRTPVPVNYIEGHVQLKDGRQLSKNGSVRHVPMEEINGMKLSSIEDHRSEITIDASDNHQKERELLEKLAKHSIPEESLQERIEIHNDQIIHNVSEVISNIPYQAWSGFVHSLEVKEMQIVLWVGVAGGWIFMVLAIFRCFYCCCCSSKKSSEASSGHTTKNNQWRSPKYVNRNFKV